MTDPYRALPEGGWEAPRSWTIMGRPVSEGVYERWLCSARGDLRFQVALRLERVAGRLRAWVTRRLVVGRMNAIVDQLER